MFGIQKMKNKEDGVEIICFYFFQILLYFFHNVFGLAFPDLFLPFESHCDHTKREKWKDFLLSAQRFDLLGSIAIVLVLW